MYRSRGFIDFRADQRRPPGPGRNGVFSRQSESPVKHDVPSNLSEAVQRAVRMRDRIENRYERARSQVRPRSRERLRSRSRPMRSRSRSRARSLRARSKSSGRVRSRSRGRSVSRSSSRPRSRSSSRRRSRSPSRQRSRSRGRSRGGTPRFRSKSRGRASYISRSPRGQSSGRYRRSRSASRGRSPGRFRRNGRVSRFEPPEEGNRSQSRSSLLLENSPFANLSFASGALSRFEAPPSPKIDTLSPDLTEDRQSTEDLYDGVANDGVQSPAPSKSFLNPTFRPIHSPRKEPPRSPKLQSPVTSIYPDVPAEVPQDVMSKSLSGSSPSRPIAPEDRYREILVLRESLRLAEERHEIETRQESFPRSYLSEPSVGEKEVLERRLSSKRVHDRLEYREESFLHRAQRRQPAHNLRPQVSELYERLSPMKRSRQSDLPGAALNRNDNEHRYGRTSPRRSESQDDFSRSSDGQDAELKMMQQSIEELKRQIREKEMAARNVRSIGYIERNGSRNEDNSASGRPPSSFQEAERRDFKLGSRSPDSFYSRVQDAPLNRELFSRRSKSPYRRRSPSPYERRMSPWPVATSPLAPCQMPPAPSAPDDALATGHYGPSIQNTYPAYISTPSEVYSIPYQANAPRNVELNPSLVQPLRFTVAENAPVNPASFQFPPPADAQLYNHCAPYDYQQGAGPSSQAISSNIPVMQVVRERPNLKTLTGANPPPQVTDTAGPMVLNNGLKKKRRKKKFESGGESAAVGTVEIGSDMDIEEDESASKDLSRKPEEKYAEEIKSYLRLTQKKDSEKERLVALKSEMSRISKLQADLLCLRKKFPDDPMLGRQLSNAAKLYDEAKKRAQSVHAQSEALNQGIFKIPQKIKLLAMEHETLFRDKIAPATAGNKAKTSPSTRNVVYKYVDRGEYFCSFCKQEFRRISAVLSHLHSNLHILNSKQTSERPWASNETQTKVSSQSSVGTTPSRVPAKGAQFLMGVNGFYCRLCKSMFPDPQMAEDHILSETHNQKYKDYISLNPFYERRVQLEKETLVHSAAVAAAPRQVSQIRSPSQPPGVESDLEKETSFRVENENKEKLSKVDEFSTNKDGAEVSSQDPHKLQSQTHGRKPKTTPANAAGSTIVLPSLESPPTKPVNPSQKSGGIRLKLLKSTTTGQPLIVGKAPFKRKPPQDTQETLSPPNIVTSVSSVKAEETPFIPSDEELEEY